MRAHCSVPSLPPLSDRTASATPCSQRTTLARMLIALLAAAAPMALQAAPKLNELQYIGSHNSYHAGFAASEATLLQRIDPSMFATLDYRHPPLTQQLNDGVRQLELDIYADVKGGRYAHPALIQQLAKAGLPAAPAFAPPGVMERPGFKVLHIQDLDQRSTCQPLVACLREIRAWSKQHPGHVPIFILLETKESPMHLAFPTVQPEPFDTATLDALDRELRSVFKPGEYISPDQVRGKAPTLNAAILAHGWPSLDDARGKVVFLFDQSSVGHDYLAGHPALRGRVCFTNAVPGEADAAFIKRNDGSAEDIARLVKAGYLVRTRTDVDLKEAEHGDTTRRDAMLASGAQLLSTDFPDHEPANSGYVVRFGEHMVARCNPQLPNTRCQGVDLSH